MVVEKDSGKEAQLIDLEEAWPCLKHTAVVAHSFWATSTASGQVSKVLQDYESVSVQLCSMAKFVFSQSPKFKGNAKVQLEVSATDLKSWVEKLPDMLLEWVGADLTTSMKETFLSVCEEHQRSLFSAGLDAVADVVKKCVGGSVPACDKLLQQQLLMKIPKAHRLKPVVTAFLKAFSPFSGQVGVCPSFQPRLHFESNSPAA